jgi:hypothetical protein
MMSIFLLLMLIPDIGRRTARYAEERWLYAAEPVKHATPVGDNTEDAHSANDHGHDAKGSGH